MVKIIVGYYEPKKTEIVLDTFSFSSIFKTEKNDTPIVVYSEMVDLTKEDIKTIIKKATRDVTIIVPNNRYINGLRSGKKVKIERSEKNDINPFDIAVYIMGIKDRDYIFNSLNDGKVSLYMPVKILISNAMKFTKENRAIIAMVDMYLWKVNPKILYAMLAYMIKPETYYNGNPKHRYMKWNFKKKGE